MFFYRWKEHVSVNMITNYYFSICWRNNSYAVPSSLLAKTQKCILCIRAIRQNARMHKRKRTEHFLLNTQQSLKFHTRQQDDDNMKNMPFISKVKWSVTYFMFKCCTFFFSHDLWLPFLFFTLLLGAFFTTVDNRRKYVYFARYLPQCLGKLFSHAICISRTNNTFVLIYFHVLFQLSKFCLTEETLWKNSVYIFLLHSVN